MNRRWLFLPLLFIALLPFRAPAPLYYSPSQGWYYAPYGQKAAWVRQRADQELAIAEQAFANGDYSLALKASRRVVNVWPLSDYAPRAQYLMGQSLEMQNRDQLAFIAYQTIVQKFPSSPAYHAVLWRQFDIANRFLNGEFFRIWGILPLYRSMDQTAALFGQVVTNGPYSDIAPYAQFQIAAAREKQKDYEDAVAAYQTAADRYYNQPLIAASALYGEALNYQKQAETAEYDQGTAEKAIASYTDFIALYPSDPRVPRAQKAMDDLRAVRVSGDFKIAQFYLRNHQWAGAVVYYDAILQLDPNSPYAAPARREIELLKPRLRTAFN
ncbi:MAG: tetratricopeptide repeat protein [Verrucomicrobia bacterium]|nr:tetratricopeptide repeat protein [Verrucomicrobiota bacterium]MDE3099874.1 tetratricopeptide repeat protein [Verrucomicrobiota bacterium]